MGKIPIFRHLRPPKLDLSPFLLPKQEAAPEPPRIVYRWPQCPACQSVELRTRNTQPKDESGRVVRYLRCDRCKARLRSIENAAGEVRVVVLTDADNRM